MTHHTELADELLQEMQTARQNNGNLPISLDIIIGIQQQILAMARSVDQLVEAKVDDIMNDPNPHIPPETEAVAAMDLAMVRCKLLQRALGRITESYPPDTEAGKIAADVLALIGGMVPDRDAVCTTCRWKAGHSPDCPRNGEPWPTFYDERHVRPMTSGFDAFIAL